MSELKSFGWYAAKVAPHLPKEAFKPVPARLFGGLTYLCIIVGGMLTVSLFQLPIALMLFISLCLGLSFAGMGFLGHEILHGVVVKRAWLRNFLGAVCFWPLTTGPRLWRKWHNNTHHVHTQAEHEDPDAWPTIEQITSKPGIIKMVYRIPLTIRSFISFTCLTFSFSLHSFLMFIRFVGDFKPNKRPIVVVQLLLPIASWIALLFVIGFTKWLFAFLIPLFIGNFIVMAYIATNHRLNPITPINDPLANSLTVTVPKWVDIIHFNFSYHTEHHLFPAMSPKYYPLVKEQIKKMWPERYHEMPMTQALVALWKTPRVYKEETKLVDPYKGSVYGSLGHGFDAENMKLHVDSDKINPNNHPHV